MGLETTVGGRTEQRVETWRDDYFAVSVVGPVVRVDRNDERFGSIEDMERSMEMLNARLDAIGRPGHRLLVDTRRAPPRNDPEFERAFAPHRRRMLSGFDRHAVLVETEVGRLQVQRHARADGTDVGAFRDEQGALAWLSR